MTFFSTNSFATATLYKDEEPPTATAIPNEKKASLGATETLMTDVTLHKPLTFSIFHSS